MLIKKAVKLILDIFFPALCFGCRKSGNPDGELLCKNCLAEIASAQTMSLSCPQCKKRMFSAKKTCRCRTAYVLGSVSAYDCRPLQRLIKLLKYERREKAAEPLGYFIAELVRKTKIPAAEFAIIPIPLSPKRQRERGFNQSELIAKQFIKNLQIPEARLLTKILARIKNTPPQAEIKTYEQRTKNIAGCFAVTDESAVSKQNVLLIDDVSTSGSTLNEAAQTLKKSGAKKIIGLTVLVA